MKEATATWLYGIWPAEPNTLRGHLGSCCLLKVHPEDEPEVPPESLLGALGTTSRKAAKIRAEVGWHLNHFFSGAQASACR